MLKAFQLDFLAALQGKSHTLPIQSPSHTSSQERLKIYRDSSLWVLINTLKNIYAISLQMIGGSLFEVIAENYVKAYPSYSPNVNDYGAQFPEWLDQQTALKKWPFIAEMARLEWQIHLVSRAPLLTATLDFSVVAKALAEEHDIRFQLLPSVVVFEADYSLYLLWQKYQTHSELNVASPVKKQKEHLVIYRQRSGICLYQVDVDLGFAIQMMQQGKSLETLFTLAAQKNISLDLTRILSVCLQEQWVQEFVLI